MIPHGVEIFVASEAIDLRWGFTRLSGLVDSQMGRSHRSGALFVFFGKRREAIKVLFADGSGLCLFYKRLDRGVFRIPEKTEADATHVVLDERALDDLLDGIDIEAKPPRAKREKRRRLH